MIRVFGSLTQDEAWSHDLKTLERLLEGCADFDHRDTHEDDEAENKLADLVTKVGRENKPLREISPYSTFFSNPEECSECREDGKQTNDLYKMDALVYIFKVWLPTYGLWGQPALRGVKNVCSYLTNAKVESWFR